MTVLEKEEIRDIIIGGSIAGILLSSVFFLNLTSKQNLWVIGSAGFILPIYLLLRKRIPRQIQWDWAYLDFPITVGILLLSSLIYLLICSMRDSISLPNLILPLLVVGTILLMIGHLFFIKEVLSNKRRIKELEELLHSQGNKEV